MSTKRIAFVCTGNICRSPMAVALAKPIFEERGISVVIISGGTLGLINRPAASNAVAAVADLGLDLKSHRSQAAQPALMRMADHIVVMAPRHKQELVARDPGLSPKIVQLWDFYPEDAEDAPLDQIDDPVGKDLEAFRQSRDIIKACLERWADSLA
ncbi:MAG: hypothetical protein VYE40_06230 [Myxococcota bacterium]|nr:hypothetical protein [Myxococcota bacterium]